MATTPSSHNGTAVTRPFQQSAEETLQQGNHATNEKRYSDAMTLYHQAADRGNPAAQSSIGYLYENGLGVPQNDVQAMLWYRKAADQGLAAAQSNIGTMYENGWGVSQDYVQAMQWYRKAADQGLAEAQFNIGGIFLHGWGVPQDIAQARYWYSQAAAKGLELAKQKLASLLVSPPPSAQSVDENLKHEREALANVYPNWRIIVGAVDTQGRFDPKNEFRGWLAKQPKAYQAEINATGNASVISAAINKFESDKAKAAVSPLPSAP